MPYRFVLSSNTVSCCHSASLGDFIDRLNVVARVKGASQLALMVAHPDQYLVFTRHGFRVSDTQMVRMAFERAGTGFSMVRKVAEIRWRIQSLV